MQAPNCNQRKPATTKALREIVGPFFLAVSGPENKLKIISFWA
jgi:hypothetical protein